MTERIRMLLYSDGSELGSQALELGSRIAKAIAWNVDILALPRDLEHEGQVLDETRAAAEDLRAAGISVTTYQRPGSVGEKLLEQAYEADYDLIVVGSRGRRGIRRVFTGSRACRVLDAAATSVLVVKGEARQEIRELLICSAAGPASAETVRFAARLAHALEASVTLLHVMSQVALEESAEGADLEAGAEELIQRGAREGRHLKNMVKILADEGVEAEALVRHGLVVDEIIVEARDGRFDMLIIGAHTTRSIGGLLSSDLSEQIMLAANRPILIVHQE